MGRAMKKTLLVGAMILVAAGLALAGSPAKTTVSVGAGTTNTVGTGSVTLALGSGIGFQTEAVVMPAAVGTTQTVYFVFGTVTNSMGTKAAATNDFVLSFTNAPWLFDGDGIYITTTATNAYTARVIGSMQR